MSRESRLDIVKNFFKEHSFWELVAAIGAGAGNVFYLYMLLLSLTDSDIAAPILATPLGLLLGLAQIIYAGKKNIKLTAETSKKLTTMQRECVETFAKYQKIYGSCERLVIQQINNRFSHESIFLFLDQFEKIQSTKEHKKSTALSNQKIFNIHFPKIETPFLPSLTGGSFLNPTGSDDSKDKDENEDKDKNKDKDVAEFSKFIHQKKWAPPKNNTGHSQRCEMYYKISSRLKDVPIWVTASHLPMITYYSNYFWQNMVKLQFIISLPISGSSAFLIAPILVYFTTDPSSKKRAAMEQQLAAYEDKNSEYKKKVADLKIIENQLESLQVDFSYIVDILKKYPDSLPSVIEGLNKFQSTTKKRFQEIEEQEKKKQEAKEQKTQEQEIPKLVPLEIVIVSDTKTARTRNSGTIFPQTQQTARTPLLQNSLNQESKKRSTCGIL